MFFTPTWTLDPNWPLETNNLIAGSLPTKVSLSTFNRAGGSVLVLTDGKIGGGITNMASVGYGTTTATRTGSNFVYTLPPSAGGWDITNITTFSGWQDLGRDMQAYNVSYSTVSAPDTFTTITIASWNPTFPGGGSAARMILTSASGVLAQNVARVKFDFTGRSIENFWAGMSEIGIFGPPSAPASFAPFLAWDTIPATATDVVGSQVTFKPDFRASPAPDYRWKKNGSYIAGATTSTLTLNNLQTTADAGSYSLEASNSVAKVSSTAATLTVNAVPAPVNSTIASVALQTGWGLNEFSLTWTIAPGSLIAGTAPSSVGPTNFANGDPTGGYGGGVGLLTDGRFGFLLSSGNASPDSATCGTTTGGSGQWVIYTLAGSATGYDLSSVVVHSGWCDNGRDSQVYTLSYSTVDAPTNFIRSINNNPTVLPTGGQSATRVTYTSATAAPLATRVAKVQLNFVATQEANWEGYNEIGVHPGGTCLGSRW